MSYYSPIPPRTWHRFQNSFFLTTNIENNGIVKLPYSNNFIHASLLGEKLAMLNKGNILQYKANSSNLTQAQKYSKIAQGKWVNRNTTWATQNLRGYTNPNTTSLKRSGNVINVAIDPITGAIIGSTTAPITCPQPIIPVNEGLPSNGGGGNIDNPEIPPPVPPTPDSETFPPIIPDTPQKQIVIQDGGILICSVQENICTGETKITISQQLYNPTSDSDVPGTIQLLYWNDGTPTWYPRQRYTMSTSNSVGVNFNFNYTIKPEPIPIYPISTSISDCNDCETITRNISNNDTITEINAIISDVLLNNMDNATANISLDQLNSYLNTLLSLSTKCTSGVIDNYKNAIQLIFIMSEYKKQKQTATQMSRIYEEDSNILNTPSLLEEWVRDRSRQFGIGLFGVDISAKAVQFKPEYLEYQRLYGIPTNLLFNPELLQAIKNKIYNKRDTSI
jgi:hypothetical protein